MGSQSWIECCRPPSDACRAGTATPGPPTAAAMAGKRMMAPPGRWPTGSASITATCRKGNRRAGQFGPATTNDFAGETTMTLRAFLVFATLASLIPAVAVAAEPVQTLAIGAAAPDFHLPGVDGRDYSLKDFAAAKV